MSLRRSALHWINLDSIDISMQILNYKLWPVYTKPLIQLYSEFREEGVKPGKYF